ncbi:MAG: hypothetical protein PHP45_02645 [Elusimicrobiales bacterium]|nr:hypothetical protein [Elusimicrobiales bacterium]
MLTKIRKFDLSIAACALTAAIVFGVLAYLKISPPVFLDFDEYYHMAVTRLMLKSGFPHSLGWFRFSMLREAYADKDLLLHIITLPFLAVFKNPLLAGKLAAVFMDGIFIAAAAALLRRYAGGFAAAALLAAFLASPVFVTYMLYLRPATLAITLTLLGLHFMAQKRKWGVFIICALFALAHISAFTMIFFAALCEGIRKAKDGEFHQDTLAYCLLGLLAGYIIHPNFPFNLATVYVNAFLAPYYAHLDKTIPFGTELLPAATDAAIRSNIPLFAAAGLMFWAAVTLRPKLSSATLFFIASAQVFCVLAAGSVRFNHQALPVALLAAAAFWGDLSAAPPSRRVKALFSCLWLAACAAGIAIAMQTVSERIRQRTSFIGAAQEAAMKLSSFVPPGANVFHSAWSDSHMLALYSPGNYYINALDPIYMHYVKPASARLYDAIQWGALEIDAYTAIKDVFGSEYVYALKISPFYKHNNADNRFKTLYENGGAVILQLRDETVVKTAKKPRLPHLK